MKILAPYPYFAPEQAASSYLWENLHEDMAKERIDCVIIVPTPTRDITKDIRDEYKKRLKEKLYNGYLLIHRFNLFREGRNPFLRALRYFLSCVIQSWYMLHSNLCKDGDVIFVVSTPPIMGAAAALVKKRIHVPFVYNLQDIFPDSLVGTGLAKKGSILWNIGRMIENFTYRNADKIIVISEDFKKNILAKGVPEEKIEVIYNWVDQNAVKEVSRSENKLIEKYDLDPSKFYVSYCGNIGLTQNMDLLMEVAKSLEAYIDIQFILVGNGAFKEELNKLIKESNISNVTMIPFQPYEDISHVFSLGDVGIIISKPGVGANSVPSKTWSIMSASRPVVANFDENELKTIIEEHQCGIFTKAGDKDNFKDAILRLYYDRCLCEEMGKKGRKFVMENLTREIGTKKYIDLFKRVTERWVK